jgi:HEAT repeat protein
MWFFLLTQLWALDLKTELAAAANAGLAQEARKQSFDSLVSLGATDAQYLYDISQQKDADTRHRWVAIRALGLIKSPEAERILLRLLSDPEPAIRTASLSALGDLGKETNVSMIARHLDDDAIIVRAAAADSLGKLAVSKSIIFLERALSEQSNYYRGSSLWVRQNYIQAMGDIAHKDAYPVFFKALSDEDFLVVQATVTALEKTAGHSFKEGRTEEQEIEAWKRWLSNQL